MATFSDVGKDITDQFSKDLAKEQNVDVNAKVNPYFSAALKANIKSGGVVAGTFAPTFKLPDYGVEIKPELTTADKDEKTFKIEVTATDAFTSGLKFELGTSNGKKGDLFFGGVYKNAKFGGITGRITFPEGKDKFLTPSFYLETPETKGFGAGANAKVVLGDNASVEAWKGLVSYKKDDFSGFFGAEQKLVDKPEEKKPIVEGKAEKKPEEKPAVPAKPEQVPAVFVVGGAFKKFDNNKNFGVNGSYNTTHGKFDVDFLFRKNYEDGTFLKLRGNIDGNVGVSRQFKPQSGVTVVLGTNVDVFTGKGNAGFQFSTDL